MNKALKLLSKVLQLHNDFNISYLIGQLTEVYFLHSVNNLLCVSVNFFMFFTFGYFTGNLYIFACHHPPLHNIDECLQATIAQALQKFEQDFLQSYL